MNGVGSKLPNDVHRIINRYLYDETIKQLVITTDRRKLLFDTYCFISSNHFYTAECCCIRKCIKCHKDIYSLFKVSIKCYSCEYYT